MPAEGRLRSPEATSEGAVVTLSPEDSHHALRVLRLGRGDPCEVVLRAAGEEAAVYAAEVTEATDPVVVRLVSRLEDREAGARYKTHVGLVQAVTRPAVMDHVFEKGTEVGASFFILVQAAASPRGPVSDDRQARWRRVVREAAKQSKQVTLPWVHAADSLGEAVDRVRAVGARSLVLDPGARRSLKEVLGGPLSGHRLGLALWIGPESGWSPEELADLDAVGAERVGLGQSVLRTETAGPVAVAAARLLLDDW